MSKWISVKDRLPANDTYVLGAFKSTVIGAKYHAVDCKVSDGRWVMLGNDRVGDTYTDTPTHWMPLPEPPKSEG